VVKTKILCSTDYESEVVDDGQEEFDGGNLGYYVLSMISAAVIGRDEISGVQPWGQSEPQRGRAALRELGDHAKTGNERVECTGMRPAEADDRMSAKSGETGYLDFRTSIVPVFERQTGAHPCSGRRYVSTAWVGIINRSDKCSAAMGITASRITSPNLGRGTPDDTAAKRGIGTRKKSTLCQGGRSLQVNSAEKRDGVDGAASSRAVVDTPSTIGWRIRLAPGSGG